MKSKNPSMQASEAGGHKSVLSSDGLNNLIDAAASMTLGAAIGSTGAVTLGIVTAGAFLPVVGPVLAGAAGGYLHWALKPKPQPDAPKEIVGKPRSGD